MLSGSSTWLNNNNNSGLLRAYSGSLFSYYGNGNNNNNDAYYTKAWSTRAVIVVGSGLLYNDLLNNFNKSAGGEIFKDIFECVIYKRSIIPSNARELVKNKIITIVQVNFESDVVN